MLRQIAARVLDAWRYATWPGDRYARTKGVRVGERCRLITRRFGSEPFLIEIGNDVTISSNVHLLTHDGAAWLIRDEHGRRFSYRRIRIGDKVFIGAGAIVLPGVEIGDRVIVAAGSVVTKSIGSGKVVAGNPAKIIGTYDRYEGRVLAYPSEADIPVGSAFKEKVMHLLDQTYRPEMEDGQDK